ncbi:hypothetical protein MBLNU13_g02977t2 [Cladosporium sp. NU13]
MRVCLVAPLPRPDLAPLSCFRLCASYPPHFRYQLHFFYHNLPESLSVPETTHQFLAAEEQVPMTTIAELVSAGRAYQNSTTSGNAQAHYGDRIIYGDSHVHNHLTTILTLAAPPLESGRPLPSRKPINTLKWLKDPHFVGREDTLQSMKNILEEYGCVALTGAGGVGKSQTAIEFCWRWVKEKPQFHIFWTYAASAQSFDNAYAQLARKLRLNCSSPLASKIDVRDGVKDWLEDNSDWLMVIDNADTYDDFFGRADGETYDTINDALPLPRPGSAMIVYTSRHARLAEDLTERHELPIKNLSLNDSKALLCNKLGAPVRDELAAALLQVLEFLPMSIAHAAAYLKFTKISVQQYLDRVKNDDGLLELLDSDSVNVGRRDDKASRSVVKVLLTTFDLLALHNAHAATLLAFMACMDRQSIAVAVVRLAIGERMAKQRKEYALKLPTSWTELESAIDSFKQLEKVALQTSRQNAARSVSMAAAKFHLIDAVSNVRPLPQGTSLTKEGVYTLMREASEEADAIRFEQDDLVGMCDFTLLTDIYVSTGDFARAIQAQERACEELSNIFGPKDPQVLDDRMRLAELKGARSVASEDLCELENDLQEAYNVEQLAEMQPSLPL